LTSFVGHHVSATFELRGGGVKAAARRVERNESLERRRAQLDSDRDDGRLLARMIVEKFKTFREGSATRSRMSSARRTPEPLDRDCGRQGR
jgi:hypothetical protein